MIKTRFLPAAEAEFLKEVAYYSRARDGLGLKFEYAVESTVGKVVANLDVGTPAAKGTRSWPVKGFPFSVVYRVAYQMSDSEILVIALMHHRRKPGYWADRIE